MSVRTAPRARPRLRWLLLLPPVALLIAHSISAAAELVRNWERLASPVEALLPLAIASLSLVAALALLAGRRIGWLLALSIVGWDLAVSLARWWVGTADFVSMALLALSALLITSRDMVAAFTSRMEPDDA